MGSRARGTEARGGAWATAAILAILVVAAAYVRVASLRGWVLSADDALHVTYAMTGSTWDVIWNVLKTDCHPPLMYLLLHGIGTMGLLSSPFHARLISVVPGTLLVLTFYAMGRGFSGRAGGLACAFLAAFSPAIVLQSQTVRHYALMLLFLSGMLAAFRTPSRRGPACYFACAVLLVLTHHVAVVVVMATGLAGLLRAPASPVPAQVRSRRRMAWALGHLAVAAVFLVVFVPSYGAGMAKDPWIQELVARRGMAIFNPVLFAISQAHAATGSGWVVVLLQMGALAGVIILVAQGRWADLAVALLPAAGYLGLALLHLYPGTGVTPPRWSLWLIPSSVIPLAVAVESVWSVLASRARACTAAAVMVVALVHCARAPLSVWTPDALRRADEGGAHWPRTTEEQAALTRLLQRHVTTKDRLMVGFGDGGRATAAFLAGWPAPLPPVELDVCPGYELGARDLPRCMAAVSPAVERQWLVLRGGADDALPSPDGAGVVEVQRTGTLLLALVDGRRARSPALAQEAPTPGGARREPP